MQRPFVGAIGSYFLQIGMVSFFRKTQAFFPVGKIFQKKTFPIIKAASAVLKIWVSKSLITSSESGARHCGIFPSLSQRIVPEFDAISCERSTHSPSRMKPHFVRPPNLHNLAPAKVASLGAMLAINIATVRLMPSPPSMPPTLIGLTLKRRHRRRR